MGMTLATKAALCVCPTLVLGTAAVSVPKVRHAIHKATASRTAAVKPKAHRKHASQYASLDLPCPPAFVGVAPALAGVGPINWNVGDLGDAAPTGLAPFIGSQPPFLRPEIYFGGSGGAGGGNTGGGGGGGGTDGGGGGTTPGPDLPGAVPEPGTWLLMVGGFGIAGGALRARRRRSPSARSMFGASAFVGLLPWRVRAGAAATLAAPDAIGVAAVAGKSATLAKLALCVCPPALIAGTVATLPSARQAVHAATAPAIRPASPFTTFVPRPLAPCLPVVESAEAKGPASDRTLIDVAIMSEARTAPFAS